MESDVPGNPCNICGDDRPSACHRFKEDDPEPLTGAIRRRQDDHITTIVITWQVIIRNVTDKIYILGYTG